MSLSAQITHSDVGVANPPQEQADQASIEIVEAQHRSRYKSPSTSPYQHHPYLAFLINQTQDPETL